MTSTLTDSFGRHIEYVRLSVTDRCDLRCFYCLPEDHRDFSEPDTWLTFEETGRIISTFASLGVSKLRITGGEPLVRRNLPQLVKRLACIPGIDDLSLSTNAVGLARHAYDLRAAGISRINVSLDSLQPERFKEITRGKLDRVLDGLMTAKSAGFSPVKINMVVMRDINVDEIEDMVAFCIEHDFTLRFIETMPIGSTGQQASSLYVNLQEIRQRLEQHYTLLPGFMPGGGPARYVQVAGTPLRIGFITPMSRHFCETCNRVRLSADGRLHLCLGQEHNIDMRTLLRSGATDKDLRDAVIEAIALKPERHEFNEKPQQVVRFMATTGG